MKKKNYTRVIAIVLVLLMALALVPIAASADGGYWIGYRDTDGAEIEMNGTQVTGETVKLAKCTVQKSGYTFLGWATSLEDAADSVVAFDDEEQVSQAALNALGWTPVGGDSHIYLYAVWGQDPVVTFYPGYDGPAAQTQAFPGDGSAAAISVSFSRDGYRPDGWAESQGGAKVCGLTESIVPPYDGYALYAVWVEQCTVTYNTEGGSPVASDTGDVGRTITLPSSTDSTRDGFTLTSWSDGEQDYDCGNSYTVNGPVTLNADWVGNYTLTLQGGGGKTSGNETTVVTSISTDTAMPYALPTVSEQPFLRTGYKFVKWLDGNNQEVSSFTFSDENPTLTVTASWTGDNVTFTYEPGDGVTSGESFTEQSKRNLDYPLPSIDSSWKVKTGKAFAGWLPSTGGSVQKTGNFTWPTDFTGTEITMTAQWVDEYAVVFKKNDGTTAIVQQKKVVSGDPIGAFPADPTWTDHLFRAWYETENPGSGDDPVTPETIVEGPMYLFAHWVPKYITVNFDPNDGSGTQTAGTKAERGKAYTLPSCTLKAPDGKMFDKWEIDGTEYEAGSSYAGAASLGDDVTEFTVKALWKDDQIDGSVTISGTPEVGKKLTATPTITSPNPPGVVSYKWQRADAADAADEDWTDVPSGTGKDYTAQAADYGKYLRCVVTCSNKPGSELDSNVLGPVTGTAVTLTFTESGGTGALTVKYSDGTVIDPDPAGSTSYPVLKNTPVTMTVTPPVGMVVDKVDGKNPSTSYSYTLTADRTVAIKYKAEGPHKTITVYPGTTLKTESTDPDSQTAKALAVTAISLGDESRVQAAVYDVTCCYDNNPSDPVLDNPDEVKKKSFTLYYPASVKKGNYGNGTYEEAWQYSVYHLKDDGTLEEVGTVTYNTSGTRLTATVTGMESFSPFVAAAAPKALKGTVIITAEGKQISSTAEVYPGQTLDFKEVTGTNAIDKNFHYTWQYSNGSPIPGAQPDQPYTVTVGDRGSSIVCVVTHETQTGEIESGAHKVNATKINPTAKYAVDYGNTRYGQISGVAAGMEYIESSAKPTSSTTGWKDVTGNTINNLMPGKYWVRYKDDPDPSNYASAEVLSYYSVTCKPDSVSGNRLYFTANDSQSYIDHPYKNVWWVQEGKAITVTATTENSTYYKVTAIWSDPNIGAGKFNQKANSLNLQVPASKMYYGEYAPYIVYASAGVYGSKTGDNSHLGLWIELAGLSALGLGAALILGKKKLKP